MGQNERRHLHHKELNEKQNGYIHSTCTKRHGYTQIWGWIVLYTLISYLADFKVCILTTLVSTKQNKIQFIHVSVVQKGKTRFSCVCYVPWLQMGTNANKFVVFIFCISLEVLVFFFLVHFGNDSLIYKTRFKFK